MAQPQHPDPTGVQILALLFPVISLSLGVVICEMSIIIIVPTSYGCPEAYVCEVTHQRCLEKRKALISIHLG